MLNRPFGAEHGDVVGSEERNIDRQLFAPREQASVATAKMKSGLLQQRFGQFGQSTFAGHTNA